MIISDCSKLSKGSNKQVTVKCDYCGEIISKRFADVIRQSHHFCNRNCSKDYQHKISLDRWNVQLGCSFKDWLYQQYIVEENPTSQIANKLGLSGHQRVVDWLRAFNIPVRTWSESRTGKLSPNYNPNLTDAERIARRDTREDFTFKQSVFKRDNYTCQKCGKHGGTLNAHHILNYKDNPDKRYDISNGVTLCDSCHIKFHQTYGYRNNTVEQFLEYME